MLKLFYRAKRLKHEKQNTTLPFYTALLSMILCMVCLAGTTWAWFTVNQVMEVESITAAEWTIENVEVYQVADTSLQSRTASDGNADVEKIMIDVTPIEDGVKFNAEADTKYAVSVSTRGNSSTGYLYVETCDGNYYSMQSDIDFELLLSEGGTVTITASWGGYSGRAKQLSEDECIGNGEVPVCSCDTLCTDEVINGGCKVCSKDHSLCLGETPKCTCENKCTEPNASCEVCKDGIGGCAGKEEKTTTEETTVDETESTDETTSADKTEVSDETTSNDETEPDPTVTTETPIDSETSESTEPLMTSPPSEVSTEPAEPVTEPENTEETIDVATDSNASEDNGVEAVSDGDVDTTEEHDDPEA